MLFRAWKGAQANVAQLVEQLTRNEQVSGSSPLVGSTKDAGQDIFPDLLFSISVYCSSLSDQGLSFGLCFKKCGG